MKKKYNKYYVMLVAMILTACSVQQPPSLRLVVCLDENDSMHDLSDMLTDFASDHELNIVDRSDISRRNLLAMGAQFNEGAEHDSIVMFISSRQGIHFLTAGNISLSSREALVTIRIDDFDMLGAILFDRLEERWRVLEIDDSEVVTYGICAAHLN